MDADTYFILRLSCPDTVGIVHAVSGFLVEHDCNITDSAQFNDLISGRFFMRVAFTATSGKASRDSLADDFEAVATRFGMKWGLRDRSVRQRALILVSKFDHCLADLLYRHRMGELDMDIPLVVSNHPDCGQLTTVYGVPYCHLPVTKETKTAQEQKLDELISKHEIDLIVLARYMQVLSDEFCARHRGRIINIHHSFLPSFKGAKPYHQAHSRGVKMIGATAHYVTPDLDEGPIIEQDIARVDHKMTPEELVARGRDVERTVLARAVKYHVEGRVLLNGEKTVVFY